MSGVNIKVLVVEDDQDSSLLLSIQLNEACPESCLFSIDCAQTLREGLDRLADKRYDIILLDLGLPDSSGLESVARVRAITDTPIIVLTGQRDHGIGAEAVSRGAQDFLCKDDVDTAALRRAMTFAIERSRTLPAQERKPAEPAAPDWSSLAHELRSPLAIAVAAVANLTDGLAGPLTPEQTQMTGLAQRNLARISRALDNVLGLARLQSGKALIEMRALDLARMATEVVAGARVVSRRGPKQVEIRTAISPDLPPARGDLELTAQVAQNLLDNALRHAQSRVTVTVDMRGDELVLSVEDDGPGVPAAKLDGLFGRFGQLERDASDSSGYKGTGLGLAICREAARAQSGHVWAEPGPGGRFYFALPSMARTRNLINETR